MENPLNKYMKGQIGSLEGFAYGILIVAVVLMVGIYLVVQVGALITPNQNATVNASVTNVTAAYGQFASFMSLIVLVGVLGFIVMLLRGGFGRQQNM